MDGVIIINKPKGCTSHDIVNQVKKILNCKVGHTGTLDPNATGVLPLLLGNGTKLSKYLINHDKEYVVELQLGIKTDTADIEGKIIEKEQVNKNILKEVTIKKVFDKFIGKHQQKPPMYSAIKVNGKKLYEYARKGIEVEVKSREIEIYKIELLRINQDEDLIEFKVDCSKGTYIRSLCENIAEELGTIGFMKELKRTKVGQFDIKESITLEEIKQSKIKVITMQELLVNNPSNIISNDQMNLFLNGVKIKKDVDDGIYKVYDEYNKFIGTGIVLDGFIKRDIIL